jgi:hypothetical protein
MQVPCDFWIRRLEDRYCFWVAIKAPRYLEHHLKPECHWAFALAILKTPNVLSDEEGPAATEFSAIVSLKGVAGRIVRDAFTEISEIRE